MSRRAAGARASCPVSKLTAALWMVDEALQRASNRDARTTGVSAADRVLLMLVGAHDGSTVADLARLLGDERANVRRAARRLEARLLLLRVTRPPDGRRGQLSLTQQGRALLAFGAPGAVGLAGTRLVTSLSPDALHAVSRAVTTIYNELKK